LTDRELLAATIPFEVLDAAALDTIVLHLGIVELADGETLFRQGDAAHALFVLTEGRLDVLVGEAGREQRVSTVTPGSCVGEIAFFDALRSGDEARARTRTATLRAQGAARLLELPAAVASRLLQSEPAFRAAFTQLMDRRLEEVRTLLSPLFGELPDALLHELQDCLERITLAAGDLLFRAGDPGDAVYLSSRGGCRCFARRPASRLCCAISDPGS
jgi:CRP-like cAMP-binding protein